MSFSLGDYPASVFLDGFLTGGRRVFALVFSICLGLAFGVYATGLASVEQAFQVSSVLLMTLGVFIGIITLDGLLKLAAAAALAALCLAALYSYITTERYRLEAAFLLCLLITASAVIVVAMHDEGPSWLRLGGSVGTQFLTYAALRFGVPLIGRFRQRREKGG